MSVGIGTAVRAGVRRTRTREGLVFALAFAVVGLVAAVSTQTLLFDLFEPALETLRTQPAAETGFTSADLRSFANALDASTPLAVGVPASMAGGGIVLAGLLAEAIRIVAVRVFVDDGEMDTDRLHPIAVPTLNGAVGGLVVWFLVGLGGVLGIVAVVVGGAVVALFLATSFLFVRQEIAVADRNFVDALNGSWQLASGHRLRLLGLGIAVVVLTVLPITVFRALFGVFFGPAVATVVGAVVASVAAVFGTAAITHAYGQLRVEPRDPVRDRTRVR